MLIDKICLVSRVDRSKIVAIEQNASIRYKTYEIPKRDGGVRVIHHPSRELKALQRLITKMVFTKLPVHSAVAAYEKNSSILLNAEAHVEFDYTTRIDFQDFFPSFTFESISTYLSNCVTEGLINLSAVDIKFVCNIVCRYERLTIGAPSSPKLTNRMMYQFDARLAEYCADRQLVYTRYADDIFISSRIPENMLGIESVVQKISDAESLSKLLIKRKKTVFLSRKRSRAITGLVITPDRKISMGRDRKREIKSLVHRWKMGTLPQDEKARMIGLLSFANDVEPMFLKALKTKYGKATLKSLNF